MKHLLLALAVLAISTSFLSAQWTTDTLSEARRLIGIGSAHDQIIFAGGKKEQNLDSRAIDIYDDATDTWRTARSPFGIGNTGMDAVSGDNHVIYFQRGSSLSRFGVFDVLRDTIYSVTFENSRNGITPIIADDKVFLAGGRLGFSDGGGNTDRVDIYDLTTNTWSLVTLPQARDRITPVSAGGKVFFLGGEINRNLNDFSADVDIYDLSTESLTTNSSLVLSEARSSIGIVVDTLTNLIYAAGGARSNSSGAFGSTTTIDLINTVDLTSVQLELPAPDRFVVGELLNDEIILVGSINTNAVTINRQDTSIASVSIGTPSSGNLAGARSASHNGKAYFINTFGTAGQFIFIYDELTREFSTFDTGAQRTGNAIGKVGNTVFVAAGATNETTDSPLVFSITGPPVSTRRTVQIEGPPVSVMPNPTSGPLRLDLSAWPVGELRLRISDVLGKVVLDFTTDYPSSAVELDLSDYTGQLYFLTVTQRQQQRTLRILKQ